MYGDASKEVWWNKDLLNFFTIIKNVNGVKII